MVRARPKVRFLPAAPLNLLETHHFRDILLVSSLCKPMQNPGRTCTRMCGRHAEKISHQPCLSGSPTDRCPISGVKRTYLAAASEVCLRPKADKYVRFTPEIGHLSVVSPVIFRADCGGCGPGPCACLYCCEAVAPAGPRGRGISFRRGCFCPARRRGLHPGAPVFSSWPWTAFLAPPMGMTPRRGVPPRMRMRSMAVLKLSLWRNSGGC